MKVHSFHIGINYAGTINELGGCINDARAWSRRCSPYSQSTTLLLERAANRTNIIETGKRILKRLLPGDLLWLTLSCHGTRQRDRSGDEKSGWDQAVVCHDLELIYDDEMAGLFKDRVKNSYVFAFLDCCHSETMHRSLAKARSIPISRCKPHERVKQQYRVTNLPGGWMMAGCEENLYCYDAVIEGRACGAFTHYGLRALDECKRGSTFNDWFRKVGGKRPRGYLPNDEFPQQPVLQGAKTNIHRPVPLL